MVRYQTLGHCRSAQCGTLRNVNVSEQRRPDGTVLLQLATCLTCGGSDVDLGDRPA